MDRELKDYRLHELADEIIRRLGAIQSFESDRSIAELRLLQMRFGWFLEPPSALDGFNALAEGFEATRIQCAAMFPPGEFAVQQCTLPKGHAGEHANNVKGV